jgi:hypothetical protein
MLLPHVYLVGNAKRAWSWTHGKESALQFWGGVEIKKFVVGPARNGEILCCHAFYPAEKNDIREDGWHLEADLRQLLATEFTRFLQGICRYGPEVISES